MVRSAGYIAYILDETCIKIYIVAEIILKGILEEIGCHDVESGQIINDRT